MKTSFAAFIALIALPCATHAAPRLVVSTPSLAPESAIDLVLDRPVTAAADLGKTVENTWLEIKPALPGKLVWKAQNIASFIPDQAPAIGTSYTFAIPKGKAHLDNSEIPAGVFATVASEPFTVRSANSQNRYSSTYSASTAEWLLIFNDDVDPAKAGSFVTFTSKSGQQVAARLHRPDRARTGPQANYYKSWAARSKKPGTEDPNPPLETPVANALVAAPLSPLPVGENWKLSILKGLPNAGGKATTAQDAVYEIGTIHPFAATHFRAQANPDEPRRLVITFNAPLSTELPADFLTQSIVLDPRPENLRAEIQNREIHLLGDFSTTDTWNVTIRPPFSSGAGIPLAAASSKEVKFPVIEPELLLPSENQAQLASGKRTYPIRTVNMEKLHIRIKRLSAADLVRAYQGYRHYTGLGHNFENIDPTAPLPYALISGQTVYDKEIELGNALDTSKEIELKWDEVLPQDLKSGAIFLDVTGSPKEDLNTRGRRNAQAIIQLTDIGLAWKLTPKEAFVYAFSCATGQPLKDVSIDLFGEDASTLKSVKTDADGLVVVERTEAARHLRAMLGGDSFVTAFDSSLNTVGLWHFPIRYSWNTPAESVRRAFLFTDRSIYRPGETVRLKGIVRTQAGNIIEPAAPAKARIVVVDPTDKEIFTQPVTLSDVGSFDVTYKLPEGNTGSYLIRLEFPDELAEADALEDDWVKQQHLRDSGSFQLEVAVEEFRRNAFEIDQGITQPATGASQVASDVTANYYQGQPVAGGNLSHYTRITPMNPYPERFRDFLFGNHRSPDWGYWYHYFGYRSRYDDDQGNSSDAGPSTVQGQATLSPEGKATLTVDIPQAEFPTSREVRISTEVTDANNQTLTASATTTVHPASVYVGVSRNDRLIRANENVAFRLVAIDPEGNPYPEPVKVTATLSREVNSAVRSQNENGETVTRNDTREENVLVSEVTIDPAASTKEGQEFTVTPKENGKYFLTLRGKDQEGRDFATVSSFHVYGADDYPWLYEDGMRVKLIAEKKSYKAGETARVLVLSPIEGTALVTVEREKVLRSFLTTLKADNPVIEIPIGEDDAPNAYVSVLIVKGAGESAREHKAPQLRLGYCELTIENQRDRLAVTLAATGPEKDTFTVATGPQKGLQLPAARPGDTVTLSGTVTTADGKPAAGAELTLYAEDEGTLAVMGYVTPNPMAYFYDPRILGIEAGVSFNNFLDENPDMREFFNKGFFIGGGADLADLADLYRKNFDPCATWAPAVKAGPDGTFSHTFTVPDTLTRYRVIAVAHAAEKFGHYETGLVINKPLMLEPKLPRFANQGDSFTPQVLVQNASEHDATWEVTFSTGREGATPVCRALGETKQSVTINAGKSATLTFPVTAESTGTSTFSWKAVPVSLGNGELTPGLTRSLTDAVEETFEVHYPMPIIRQVKFVKLDKEQSLLSQIDPELLSGTGEITLEFSRSPLTEISGSVDYLLRYPHGCVEQTTSALMPWFAVESLRSVVPSFAKVPEEKRKAAIQKGADRLLSMQLSDGSFTYWPGRQDRVDWATPYVGLGLILAKENGAQVPQSAIDRLAKYLTGTLRGIADVKSPSFLENQARALWVLALAGQPQPSYQSVLLDRIADLSPSGRAFLALAYNASGANPATAKSILVSKVPFRLKEDGWMRWNANDAIRLLAWSTIDPQAQETVTTLDRMIHERNPYGHWNTTWANGWGLLAVSTYAKNDKAALTGEWSAEMDPPLSSGTVTLNNDQPTVSANVAITPDLKLNIRPKGTGYVRIKVASKPRIEPLKPVAKNGLAVDRIYERIKPDGSAEILTEPKVGDLIRVSLRVTLPNDDTKYLVVEDLLPSLFETVNTDFKTQGTGTGAGADVSTNRWEISHSELRTDRAVFYLDQIWKKGTYTITYLARCTVPGVAMAPPAKVEGMYDPDFHALSASREFTTK